MNYGETVGIPQGNVVSDFISELLLAYIDYKLVERLAEIKTDLVYKILRYRDDYRIFTNSPVDSALIQRELSILLRRYKLNIGDAKTSSSSDIITGAIKEDKLFWLEHDPVIKITTDKFYQAPKVFLRKSLEKQREKAIDGKAYTKFIKHNFHNRIYSATLQKHLMILKIFSDKHPNSGQLIAAFLEFENRIASFDYSDFEKTGTDIKVLIAILIDIIKKNPKVTEVGIKLLSTILQKVKFKQTMNDFFAEIFMGQTFEHDYDIKFALINSISENRASNDANSLLELWMQRLVVKKINQSTTFIDSYLKNSKNELVQLCNSVILKERPNQIFNEEWLKEEFRVDLSKFINISEIENLTDIISGEEISMAEYNRQN